MHIVDSNLLFAMAPTSIKLFDEYKSNLETSQLYDKASLYIIAKRPVHVLRVMRDKEIESLFEVPEEIRIQQTADNMKRYADSVKQMKEMMKCGRLVALEVSQTGIDTKLHGFFQLPADISHDVFIENLPDFSFEEIIYYAAKGYGAFITHEDITPFLKYEVLYVGQCVAETLTNRFKAHHALQKMLIHEKVISNDYLVSDELVIIPLYSESKTISSIDGDTSVEEIKKIFTNDFSFGTREVNLDCEKALVRGINPKYNSVKFKNYPKSEDGLYKGEAEVFCYTIAENIILKYDEGLIYGSRDTLNASRIIGDKTDNTIAVYEPGVNYTQKYAERFF